VVALKASPAVSKVFHPPTACVPETMTRCRVAAHALLLVLAATAGRAAAQYEEPEPMCGPVANATCGPGLCCRCVTQARSAGGTILPSDMGPAHAAVVAYPPATPRAPLVPFLCVFSLCSTTGFCGQSEYNCAVAVCQPAWGKRHASVSLGYPTGHCTPLFRRCDPALPSAKAPWACAMLTHIFINVFTSGCAVAVLLCAGVCDGTATASPSPSNTPMPQTECGPSASSPRCTDNKCVGYPLHFTCRIPW
jgi:hypothetical protein